MRLTGSFCLLLAGVLVTACAEPSPELFSLHEISPPLAALSGGATVQLHGQGYVAGTRVFFAEQPAEVKFDSPEQLSAVVPPGPLRQGPVSVRLQRPDGLEVSREDLFTYYAPPRAVEPHLLPPSDVRAMAVADFNHDGRADLAVVALNPAGVTLLLSQPDGSLRASQRADAGSQPLALALADVSGDGQPDLVVADAGQGTVRVLLGRSDGSLIATSPWAVGCSAAAVATVMAGDRRVDLIVLCQEMGAGARLLRNSGSRAGAPLFDLPLPLSVGSDPAAIVSADFDGDGAADVAVANRSAGTVSILWGAPGGGFLPPVAVAVGRQPVDLLAADVAGDSRPELLVADAGNADVRLLTYDAAVGLTLSARTEVASPAQHLVALPRKGGGLEIAALGASGAGSSLLTALSGQLTRRADFVVEGKVSAVAALDVDADGQPELVLAHPDRGPLSVRSKVGSDFGPRRELSVQGTPWGAVAADADGDGLVDAVWGDAAVGGLRVLLNQASEAAFIPLPPLATAAGAAAVAVADLNGDYVPDLVAACPDAGIVSLIISVGPSRFQPSISIPAGTRPELIAAAEVTGDRNLDVIVGTLGDTELRVLAGVGNGSLKAPLKVPVGAGVRALLAFDVDGDGRRDAVVLAEDGVRLLRRDAAGNLYTTLAGEAGEAPDDMTLLDANTDGVWDLAVASRRRGRLQLLLGRADGRFVSSQSVTLYPPPRWLTAVDVNRDGYADVVVGVEGDSTLQLLLGKPDATLQPPIALPIGLAPSGLLHLDVDGDRVPELMAVGAEGYSLVRSL